MTGYASIYDAQLQTGHRTSNGLYPPPRKGTPETKFLEPGIGTGRTALWGYSYTGVDISQEMMDQLRHKLPDNLTLLQADATSLPFENNSFDVLLTVHVLQVIPGLKTLSAEC